MIKPRTIADGLLVTLSRRTFEIISKRVDDIFTVTEESIIECMRLVWERMKIIIEPSAAVPMAALIKHISDYQGKKIGIIFSGGNIDLKNLPF